MNESERIAGHLHGVFFARAWHGPSVKEALDGVSAETAAAKPLPGTHSIWELVHHLHAWIAEADATVRGKKYETLKGDKDWPPVTDVSRASWEKTLTELEQSEASLEEAIRAFPPEKLGQGHKSFYYLLHGIGEHNAYHAAQIVLLKKMASPASGPAPSAM